MREIGAFEAKSKFGQLLDLVEHGEEITITRHGKEVARLVPAKHGFNRAEADAALVPALWRLEVANSLTMAVRRRRIDPDFRRAALADLALLDITTDQQTDSYAWTDTLNLADRFQLTVYDAAYLELAQRRVLPLATLDQDLRNAAMAIGVEVLGTELK